MRYENAVIHNIVPMDYMAAISQTIYSVHFLQLKFGNGDCNFTEVCSKGSTWQ